MKKQIKLVLASGLLGSTALAPAAFAQDAAAEGDQVQAVYDRYRPDYNAPGIRTGSFLFFPTVEAGLKYDSNIYAKESGVTKDFIAVIKPSFALVSDWNSDYFALMADADIGRYFDEGTEDYEDFKISATGRKDISHGTSISLNASYKEGHEDRGSADAVGNAVKPTPFSVMTAKIGFKRDVSVLSLAVDGTFEKRDFDNVDRQGGGISNNDRRDRDRMTGKVRFGYEMADGYEAFVRGTMDRVEYDDPRAPSAVGGTTPGINRNSDGLEIVGGAAFDLTGKAKGEIFAGYLKRAYDSDSFDDTDGMSFGAQLLWNLNGLTSFTGGITRSIDETTVGAGNTAAPGILTTTVHARVEHELRRNVLMFSSGSYSKQDFRATARDDDLINVSGGVKYLVNRNMHVGVRYDYKYRETTEQGQDYSRHALMVNLKAQW